MFVTISINADETNKHQNENVTFTQTEEVNDLSINDSKTIELYKLLYENTKRSNEIIISTIQWTIGFIFTFLLALIGSQVLYNIRLNKKEIENIKSNVEKDITEISGQLNKEINNITNENINKIDNKIESIRKEMIGNINDKIAEQNKLYEANVELHKKDIKIYENTINSKLKELEIKVQKNVGDIWGLKGVKANALSSFVTTAKLIIGLKHESKYILSDIIEVLKELKEIHKIDYEDLNDLIEMIPKENMDKKTEIIALYYNKPVYIFVDNPNSEYSDKEYVKNQDKRQVN